MDHPCYDNFNWKKTASFPIMVSNTKTG